MAEITGRLRSRRRAFTEVVDDIRHITYSVIRHRKAPQGMVALSLGSGFFIAPKLFMTCYHVMNSPAGPHQEGDIYHLVGTKRGNTAGKVLQVMDAKVGKNLHLYPEKDLALLIVDDAQDQPYAALSYSDVHEGSEIGIAGYPLPQLTVVNGQLHYGNLKYRVGRGIVTARYSTTINPVGNGPIPNAPIVEVNFLFVPGNSGGPVFESETGRVVGFVQGFNTAKILERIQKAGPSTALPSGVSPDYIHSMDAIYSLAIKLDLVRNEIESFGASL